MNFERHHRNLNLFWHFGDSAQNENNTTRAFLIAASRSPWSSILLRGFSDLACCRASDAKPAFGRSITRLLTQWPESIELSLERDITPESFPGAGVRHAILVELTPQSGASQEPAPTEDLDVRGRVDATIVLRGADGNGLGLIVESKLYHRAGRNQLERYRRGLETKGISTVLISVSWEEVYTLANSLPEEASYDPIMSDFKSFLERDSRLTGFTGFRIEDFSLQNDLMDEKLGRCCNKLLASPVWDARFTNATLERKRGGLDYDVLLANQSVLIGNLGVATWENDALYLKLVVGWRRHWQTAQLLDSARGSKGIPGVIAKIAGSSHLELHVNVRPHFSRFDYQPAAVWNSGAIDTMHAEENWLKALEFTKLFHGKPLDKSGLKELQSNPNVWTDSQLLKRAFDEQVNCFVPVDFVVSWKPSEIGNRNSGEQIELLRSTLSELAAILFQLSGQGKSSQ